MNYVNQDVADQVCYEMSNRTWDQIRMPLYDEVDRQTWIQVISQVDAQSEWAVNAQVKHEVRVPVMDQATEDFDNEQVTEDIT